MATKLYLIRHGITAWNIKKRYCGFIDVALSEKGKRQARRLYHRLKDKKFHSIYSSDRKRALQTARIAFKGLAIEVIPDLREMHFGCFEGLTHAQLLKKHPRIYRKWLSDPHNVTIPKGENLKGFKSRIVNALRKIIKNHPGEKVAIVCHGGAISVYLMHLLKTKDFWKRIPHSASITVIESEGKKMRLIAESDTRHLEK